MNVYSKDSYPQDKDELKRLFSSEFSDECWVVSSDQKGEMNTQIHDFKSALQRWETVLQLFQEEGGFDSKNRERYLELLVDANKKMKVWEQIIQGFS